MITVHRSAGISRAPVTCDVGKFEIAKRDAIQQKCATRCAHKRATISHQHQFQYAKYAKRTYRSLTPPDSPKPTIPSATPRVAATTIAQRDRRVVATRISPALLSARQHRMRRRRHEGHRRDCRHRGAAVARPLGLLTIHGVRGEGRDCGVDVEYGDAAGARHPDPIVEHLRFRCVRRGRRCRTHTARSTRGESGGAHTMSTRRTRAGPGAVGARWPSAHAGPPSH